MSAPDLSGLTCDAFRRELDRVSRQAATDDIGVERTPSGNVEITLRYENDQKPAVGVIRGP